MNPHSQIPDLNVADQACFSEVSKFPEVYEQQFILDADDMDDMVPMGAQNPNENYK
jgi:hypothetical protein